jgi:hypothetical protein
MDPRIQIRIRIRIHTKMSWIRNTACYLLPVANLHKTGYLTFLLYIFVGFLAYSTYCIGVTLTLHLKCTVLSPQGPGCPTENRTGNSPGTVPCSRQTCYPIINVFPLTFYYCSVSTYESTVASVFVQTMMVVWIFLNFFFYWYRYRTYLAVCFCAVRYRSVPLCMYRWRGTRSLKIWMERKIPWV